MTRWTFAILVAPFVFAVHAHSQTTGAPPRVTEELIAERPEKGVVHAFRTRHAVAPDLGKVAWIQDRDVVVNGQPLGPAADEFLEPAVSPDGQRVLRAGRQGKSWFVWLDAKQVGGPFEKVRRAHFTSDGRVVFAGRQGQDWTWFVDGREQPVKVPALKEEAQFCKPDVQNWWNDVDAPSSREAVERCWSAFIAVARDHVAYPIKRADGWHLVADGQEGPPFERILQITYSPDGSRLAYLGLRKNRVVAVVDGKEEPAHANVAGLRFSPDSRRIAYLAVDTKDARGQIIVDGVPGRSYPALIQNIERDLRAAWILVYAGFWDLPDPSPFRTGATAPLFRADGKVVYAGRTSALARGTFEVIGGGLELVPDIEKQVGHEGIWVEGADQPLFAASLVVAGPVRSAEGEHLGWVEVDPRSGAWVGLLDGRPTASVSGFARRTNSAEHPTLSRDGARMAFVHVAHGGGLARGDRHALRRVVSSGIEEKVYDADDVTNLRFSNDGRHLAYEVHGAKEVETRGGYNGLVVLDGVPGRVYSDVLPGTMRFVSPDTVRYLARIQETKGGAFRYYRVTQAAPSYPVAPRPQTP